MRRVRKLEIIKEIITNNDEFQIIKPWPQVYHMLFFKNDIPAIALTSKDIFEIIDTIIYTEKDTLDLVDIIKLENTINFLKEILKKY